MLKIKFKSLVLLMAVAVGFSSCKDYFGDINVDPNNPTDVPANLMLPTIQAGLAYTYGGDATRFSALMSQHIDGTDRQFLTIREYIFQGADVDALWDNLYQKGLMQIKQLNAKATSTGQTRYLGIAQALEVYTWLAVTDLFGDVPYSQALQGVENIEPTYDSQEAILTDLLVKLDAARTSLAATNTGPVPNATSDLIYGGSVASWTKFCNVLEARIHLRMAKRNAAHYQDAADALAAGAFTSSADDARVAFGAGGATTDAPWAQFISQRAGYAEAHPSYTALLNGLNDPREAIFCAAFTTSHPYFTTTQKVALLSYTEQKFIEAEVELMRAGGSATAAHTAYLDAIAASFDDLAISADYAAYVAQPAVDPGSASLTRTEVMTQKYIALYTDPEVFSDWRRTGLPALTPNVGTEIPRRFPYPQNETLTNPNTPAGVSIFSRVWWDAL